jgi:hypothetical protein
MNVEKEVQCGQSQLQFYQFIACCMFWLCEYQNQAIKMYNKKGNINTVHKNETFQAADISFL